MPRSIHCVLYPTTDCAVPLLQEQALRPVFHTLYWVTDNVAAVSILSILSSLHALSLSVVAVVIHVEVLLKWLCEDCAFNGFKQHFKSVVFN